MTDGEIYKPNLAPPTTAEAAESTTTGAHCQSHRSLFQATSSSSQILIQPSYSKSKSQACIDDGYNTLVLRNLPEEELISRGVLRSVWCVMDVAITKFLLLGQWALARCPTNSKTEKPIPFQRKGEGTSTRTRWQGKEQRKRKSRRVSWNFRNYTMAIIFISAAVLGCDLTSNGAEGATDPSSQAGRRSHLRASSPSTQPWTGDHARGGIVPGKVPGNGPQVIKQASQRLEASGKTAAKLKVELSQLAAQWQKFQKKVEDEYTQQKQKYLEKQKQLQDALTQAEEEYNAAQLALRERQQQRTHQMETSLHHSNQPKWSKQSSSWKEPELHKNGNRKLSTWKKIRS